MVKMNVPELVKKSLGRLNIEDSLFNYDNNDPRYINYKRLLNGEEIDSNDAECLATSLQSEVEWLEECEEEDEENGEGYDEEWSRYIENVKQFASQLMTLSYIESN